MVQERLSGDRHQGLRQSVRDRLESRPETCRENHRFHLQDFLNVKFPMGHRYLNVKPVGQMLGQMLGAVNRAVLSASASETNLKMGELPLNEAFDMVIDKVIDVVQELCDSAVILKEFYDLLVEPRELTVMLVLAWIVDGAAVKDVASSIAGCVNRNAFLVSETEDSHFQTFVLGDVVELRHRGEFGEDLVQIRIILERRRRLPRA